MPYGPRLLRSDRPGRGVEGDQHVRLRLDQREAAGDRLAALDEGLRAGRIEHDDVGLERNGRELPHIVADAQALGRNVGVSADAGIDRDEIVLAGQLHAVAGKIHHRDGARPRGLRLLDEVAKALAQRVAVEIARADDVEAGRLQRLRDQSGIVRGRCQRRLGIGAVADHEGDALLRLLRARLARRAGGKGHDRQEKANEESERPTHGLLARYCS
jgi:hypothetical protein